MYNMFGKSICENVYVKMLNMFGKSTSKTKKNHLVLLRSVKTEITF